MALNGVTSIGPGESAIFVLAKSTDVSTPALTLSYLDNFRSFWGLPPSVQVGHFLDSGTGLSSGGDGVAIFNAANTEVTRVTFGAATTGRSFYYVYNSSGTMLSTGAPISALETVGAFISANALGNVGSPGISASSLDLAFTSGINRFAKTGTLYSSPITF